MRIFLAFVAILLLFAPAGGAEAIDYFDENAVFEFCTYEQPPEGADAVSNGLFWEVRATSENRREVFAGLKEVKAVSVTLENYDRERVLRDFRARVQSVQRLPDVTVYYCKTPRGGMQIAEREGLVKIGIPALLNSY